MTLGHVATCCNAHFGFSIFDFFSLMSRDFFSMVDEQPICNTHHVTQQRSESFLSAFGINSSEQECTETEVFQDLIGMHEWLKCEASLTSAEPASLQSTRAINSSSSCSESSPIGILACVNDRKAACSPGRFKLGRLSSWNSLCTLPFIAYTQLFRFLQGELALANLSCYNNAVALRTELHDPSSMIRKGHPLAQSGVRVCIPCSHSIIKLFECFVSPAFKNTVLAIDNSSRVTYDHSPVMPFRSSFGV